MPFVAKVTASPAVRELVASRLNYTDTPAPTEQVSIEVAGPLRREKMRKLTRFDRVGNAAVDQPVDQSPI